MNLSWIDSCIAGFLRFLQAWQTETLEYLDTEKIFVTETKFIEE